MTEADLASKILCIQSIHKTVDNDKINILIKYCHKFMICNYNSYGNHSNSVKQCKLTPVYLW